MIRRFENNGLWYEFRGTEMRSHNVPTWDYAWIGPEDCIAAGYNEVFSGFDPNDLQLSKPCCGGGMGPGIVSIYGNGKWHDSDCDSLKAPQVSEKADIVWGYEPNYRSSGKRCECGAGATSNPNAHSFWCPEWKKL